MGEPGPTHVPMSIPIAIGMLYTCCNEVPKGITEAGHSGGASPGQEIWMPPMPATPPRIAPVRVPASGAVA